MKKYDALIIGFGKGGKTLAAALGKKGTQENARGSAPRPRHCERASRRTAVLAESDACLVLYLNDLTLFYLRCRFACVSTVFSNLRLLRIFIVLLLPATSRLGSFISSSITSRLFLSSIPVISTSLLEFSKRGIS